MRRSIVLVVLVLAFLALASPGCDAPGYPPYDRNQLLRETADMVIVPAYEDAAMDGAALHAATTALCAAPSATTLEAARSAWHDALVSWRTTTPFHFGPVHDMNLNGEIGQWPASPTSIEAVIAGMETIGPHLVDSQGSPAKGFAALEYLLFAYPGYTAPDDAMTLTALGDTRRCGYADALAEHIARVTERARVAWAPDGTDFAHTLATAGASDNATYRYVQGAVDALVSEMTQTIEVTRDDRLGKPLGRITGGGPVESPYANASVASMQATLDGVDRGWTAPPHGLDAFLRTRSVTFADRYLGELRAARTATDALATPALGMPWEAYVAGTDHAAGDAAFDALGDAQTTLRADVASTLGLSIVLMADGD